MHRLGAQLVQPILKYLDQSKPNRDPATWSGWRRRLEKLLLKMVGELPASLRVQARHVLLPPTHTLASLGDNLSSHNPETWGQTNHPCDGKMLPLRKTLHTCDARARVS